MTGLASTYSVLHPDQASDQPHGKLISLSIPVIGHFAYEQKLVFAFEEKAVPVLVENILLQISTLFLEECHFPT